MSLRFGLIGTGGGGHLFAGALARRPGGAQLVSVCSRNREKATVFGAIYGVTEVFTDWRELIAAPDIDAICVASPTGDHAPMTIGAAAGGLHVLTEKPIANTVSDADAMIAACEQANVTLGCIYMYRFMDTAVRMKEAIDGGLIGQPLMAECTALSYRDQPYYDSAEWRGKWETEGGGSLVTQTSHTLDLMVWMLGDVEAVAGFYTTSPLHRIEVEDQTLGVLRFTSGALATVLSTTAAVNPQPRRLTIYGTRGTVGLVDDDLVQWDVPGGPSPEIEELLNAEPVDRGDTLTMSGYADPTLHFRQMEDFVAAIAEGRPPLVDGWEGRRTTAVMEALYESSRRGQVLNPA
ncbi:MAG: Gfo/Idh/MocA family oxidoreductase [Actinomycetia bacterium]|nr:Gfo/Idh/MocA family oxidoreductase [Actinomycetes bacterium]